MRLMACFQVCFSETQHPSHFIKNGRTITDIKLGELIGKVDILDFSFLKKNEAVTSEMLKSFTFGEKIILFFNWSKNFKDQKRFYSNYPYVSDDACDYLIEKKVKLVGMDTPSPDDSRLKLGSEEDSKVHKKLLQANIILIEYLNNLDSLDTFDGWKIIAMPLNLNGCDGAPARVCLIKEF